MNVARLVLSFVMLTMALMGGVAFVSGVRLLLAGDPNVGGAITAVVMGIVLAGLAFAYAYMAHVRGPREEFRLAGIRAAYPGQPWMERKDWAARRVEHSTKGPAVLMWVWTAGWWFFIVLIGTVNREKILKAIEESWWNAGLIAVFVGAGLIGLSIAVSFTRNQMRYGRSSLVLDTLPAFMGETFHGTLTARLSPLPKHPLSVELTCMDVRWVTTGHSEKRTTRRHTNKLGFATATADPRTFSPSQEGMRGRISIDVPAGLPVSFVDDRGNGIRWTLRVATKGDDAPFSCEFEIPVFNRTR